MVSRPEIGRDIKWFDVIRQVFRVLEFDRAGTTLGPGDIVKARTRFKPYGYLLVESPIFSQPVRLPIVHRDDFLLASSVFDEPHLLNLVTEEELLVTYAPKQHTSKGHALGGSHVLHYVIVPRGTLEQFCEHGAHMTGSALKQIFGDFVYEGEIKVQVNPDPYPADSPEPVGDVDIDYGEPVVSTESMEIIKAFGKFLSENQPIIPDAQLLPYPKSQIAKSLLLYEHSLCDVANEYVQSHDLARLEEIEETLGPVRSCRGLVAAYSDIEPQDVKAVSYFNSFKTIRDIPKDKVDECLDLLLKYAAKGFGKTDPS